jgi:hypothetical protein
MSPPPQNCTLWRYVDLTKLLSLLETKSLHFTRADQFEDPYEGRLSQAIVDKLREADKKGVENFAERVLDGVERDRQTMFVNCWCASEHESAAMWRLYVQSAEGVAIRTDHDTLLRVLEPSPLIIRTTLVKYVDYATTPVPFWNGFFPFVHKRLSFKHEQELRAIIWSHESPNVKQISADSVVVKLGVEPKELIKAIHVSPTAPKWLGELVDALAKRYDLTCEIVRSNLYDRPVY